VLFDGIDGGDFFPFPQPGIVAKLNFFPQAPINKGMGRKGLETLPSLRDIVLSPCFEDPARWFDDRTYSPFFPAAILGFCLCT